MFAQNVEGGGGRRKKTSFLFFDLLKFELTQTLRFFYKKLVGIY